MKSGDIAFFSIMAVLWTILIIVIVIPAPEKPDKNKHALITNSECVTICHETFKNNTTLSSKWQLQSKNTS